MIHVRHAAAIASRLCKMVLITHGESGRSGVGRTRNVTAPTSLAGQFEQPYGPMGPPTLFAIPVPQQWSRSCSANGPCATFKEPIIVDGAELTGQL
jgi:hypothetical protein